MKLFYDLESSIFQSLYTSSLKDFSDILNSIITTAIILIFVTLVGFKSYVVSPLECYAPDFSSGLKFDEYLKSYCWTTGTMVIPGNTMPMSESELSSMKKIAYYQWIPFLLLLQCVGFYLPGFFWNIACHFNHGTDLTIILKSTIELAQGTTDNTLYDRIISSLEDLFFVHRDYRHDMVSDLKRRVHKKCKFLICSKRMATKLSSHYLILKGIYFANAVGQIFLMKRMLNIQNWSDDSFRIFSLILSGQDWKESVYFPRVSFCRVNSIRGIASPNNLHWAQCVLPINMLNEKIFIFLFLWFPIVAFVTGFSFMSWVYRLWTYNGQTGEVKNLLKMRQSYKKMDKLMIDRFLKNFLRTDGLFLIYMMRMNCGDVVTSSIVNGLYKTFYLKYRKQDFNHDVSSNEIESLSLKLEPGGKGSVKMCTTKPTAPDSKDFL